MNKIDRILTNICSDNLTESQNFYTKLFDFHVAYDSNWFVHLVSKDKKLELGIIHRTNEHIPSNFQSKPQGFYITFVVDNANDAFKTAQSENFEIVSEPSDTVYGQRRLLLKDPVEL